MFNSITTPRILSAFLLLFWQGLHAQTVNILFDATKGEQAGNADWVIDADLHNICMGSAGTYYFSGACSESNPVITPTPAQTSITSGTVQTYWQGGISAWGVECVKKGYHVETLPYDGQITYNNSSNPQDLKNYKIYIVCEPNVLFNSAEKSAIVQFVANGGSLFMVADHESSDRNGDGEDSRMIWNDLMFNNSVKQNPFGIYFDSLDFSGTFTNFPNRPTDSLIHGSFGNISQVKWSGGTSMTLYPANNPSVKAACYRSGTQGNNNVLVAYARYGKGKVAAWSDSSPFDDGSGDPTDVLYDGWITDASGNHRKFIMNTTEWLAAKDTSLTQDTTVKPNAIIETETGNNWQISPNPFNNELTIHATTNGAKTSTATLYNALGQTISSKPFQESITISTATLPKDIYFIAISNETGILQRQRIIKQ